MKHYYERRPPQGSASTSPSEGSMKATFDPPGDGRRSSSQKRRPMKPRHDEPQENLYQTRHTFTSTKPQKKSTSNRKPKEIDYDELDEASREAHIVQTIERAIRKSKSERKAAVRSRSKSTRRRPQDPPPTPQDPPTNYGKNWDKVSVADENYQMINKHSDESPGRSRQKRRSSSKSRQQQKRSSTPEKPIPLLKTEGNKYKRTLIDLDERMDNLDQLDGIVDSKKGFQVYLDDEWLRANLSDPTLDTYEDNHFTGKDNKQKMNMLDPQRIQCGPGRSVSGTVDSSILTGRDTDPVIGIIDRINERKDPKKGNVESYTKRGDRHRRDNNGNGNHRSSSRGRHGKAANDEQLNSSELISFDNYEDDDGYYYEDDEDDLPIYPSSNRSGPPKRIMASASTMPEPALVEKFNNLMAPYRKNGSEMEFPLQNQLDEINRLHKDIQRQQELIEEANRHSAGETDAKRLSNRHETSAEVYQRELAKQAQAEIYRMELEQKAMMLERQMEIYRRNQEEWDKVRNLAVKEEEARKRMAEQAKKAWQDELQYKLQGGNDGEGIKELRDDDKDSSERSSEQDSEYSKRYGASTVSSRSDTNGQSLYDKVAYLNRRSEMTEEDQKVIEIEILKELHMELSKQAAEKKIMQKPLFFSDKLRSSWSGKQAHWANSPKIPTEVVTEELSRQIQQLGLEMAPSKYSSRTRRDESRRHSEGSKKKGLPLFKSNKNRSKDENMPPRVPGYAARDESYRQTKSIPYDDDSRDRVSDFTSEPDDEHRHPVPPREEHFRTHKKGFLGKLGFRKSKDRKKQPNDMKRILEGQGLIMSSADDYIYRKSERPQRIDEPGEDIGHIAALSPKQLASDYSRSGLDTSYSAADQSSTSAAPKATESQKTQRTSNKVYIGVNENSIETMSFTPRNNRASVTSTTAAARDDTASQHSSTVDRYAAVAGGNAKVTPGLHKRTTSSLRHRNEDGVDDPTLFEYLEVQYFPNEEEDEEEAPDDELEADVQLSQRSTPRGGGGHYRY